MTWDTRMTVAEEASVALLQATDNTQYTQVYSQILFNQPWIFSWPTPGWAGSPKREPLGITGAGIFTRSMLY